MKVAVNTAKLLRNVPLPDEIATVHDNAIIIDLGTGTTRIGFSGEDAPRLRYPTVIGQGKEGVECFDKAYKQRGSIPISNVMDSGIVQDWNGMEALMLHISDMLNLTKEPKAPILISEGALVPKEQRERLVQILFDTVKVHALYFSPAPVLSLYSSGRTTGMAIEMGHGTCHTVPVYEGFGLFHSILQLDFGGVDLTNAVGELISRQNVNLPPHFQHDVAQFLKEKHCECQPSKSAFTMAVSESNRGDVVAHTLPDGSIIRFGPERYRPVEALFDPTLLGKESLGIHTLAADSIKKCDEDIAPLMYGNIVLAGGTSLFKGLQERLSREIQDMKAQEKVRVSGATERRDATWVGGSILASLPTFQDMWVTRAEYDESPDEVKKCIAHKNCF